MSATKLTRLLNGETVKSSLTYPISIALRTTVLRAGLAFVKWKADGFPDRDIHNTAIALRQLLEAGTLCLLNRTDPFRTLALYKSQVNNRYSLTKRNLIAIQWAGDILPDSKSEKAFTGEMDPKELNRALFSKHSDEFIWTPGIGMFVEYLASNSPSSSWETQLVDEDPIAFNTKSRSQLNGIFSTVSKLVHVEWLISEKLLLDVDTLRTNIQSAIYLLSVYSAALSMCDLSIDNLQPSVALRCFRATEKVFGSI